MELQAAGIDGQASGVSSPPPPPWYGLVGVGGGGGGVCGKGRGLGAATGWWSGAGGAATQALRKPYSL